MHTISTTEHVNWLWLLANILSNAKLTTALLSSFTTVMVIEGLTGMCLPIENPSRVTSIYNVSVAVPRAVDKEGGAKGDHASPLNLLCSLLISTV